MDSAWWINAACQATIVNNSRSGAQGISTNVALPAGGCCYETMLLPRTSKQGKEKTLKIVAFGPKATIFNVFSFPCFEVRDNHTFLLVFLYLGQNVNTHPRKWFFSCMRTLKRLLQNMGGRLLHCSLKITLNAAKKSKLPKSHLEVGIAKSFFCTWPLLWVPPQHIFHQANCLLACLRKYCQNPP